MQPVAMIIQWNLLAWEPHHLELRMLDFVPKLLYLGENIQILVNLLIWRNPQKTLTEL